MQTLPADSAALLQPHDNSAARNPGPHVTRTGSSPMTVRSAILLCAASSAVRLAHLKDFREWITRPFRSRLRFVVSCSVGPARRDHLIQPFTGNQAAAILMPANQFKSAPPGRWIARIYARDLCARGGCGGERRRRWNLTRRETWLRTNSWSEISNNDQQQQKGATQRFSRYSGNRRGYAQCLAVIRVDLA